MKKLKFFVAIAGISLATICSVQNANAKVNASEVRCEGANNICGVSTGGCVINGTAFTI